MCWLLPLLSCVECLSISADGERRLCLLERELEVHDVLRKSSYTQVDVPVPEIAKHIVAVPVPRIRKEIGKVIQPIQQEQISDRVSEQIVDVPGDPALTARTKFRSCR